MNSIDLSINMIFFLEQSEWFYPLFFENSDPGRLDLASLGQFTPYIEYLLKLIENLLQVPLVLSQL